MVPQPRYPKGADQTRLYRRLLEGLAERPELQASASASLVRSTPATRARVLHRGTRLDRPRRSAVRASRHRVGRLLSRPWAFRCSPGARSPIETSRTRRRSPSSARRSRNVTGLGRIRSASASASTTSRRTAGSPSSVWSATSRQLGLGEEAPALLYMPYEQFALPFTSVVGAQLAAAGQRRLAAEVAARHDRSRPAVRRHQSARRPRSSRIVQRAALPRDLDRQSSRCWRWCSRRSASTG